MIPPPPPPPPLPPPNPPPFPFAGHQGNMQGMQGMQQMQMQQMQPQVPMSMNMPPLPPMPLGGIPSMPPIPSHGSLPPMHGDMNMPPIPHPNLHVPPMIQGPKCPAVFEGHIANREASAKDRKSKYVQELHFGFPIQLEGIHIVPNQITPPGHSITGRTKPDLMTSPFQLQLFGRVCSHQSTLKGIVPLLSLTVNGGVQWMPVQTEVSQVDIDYIAFSGDYSEITVILHGKSMNNKRLNKLYASLGVTELGSEMEEEADVDDSASKPASRPPAPKYFQRLVIPSKSMEELSSYLNSIEITASEEDVKRQLQEYNQLRVEEKLYIPKSFKEIISQPLPSSSTAWTKIHVEKVYLSRLRQSSKRAFIPVKLLAEFVGKIFSLDVDGLLAANIGQETLQTIKKDVEDINNLAIKCFDARVRIYFSKFCLLHCSHRESWCICLG
jgi:hypothetical protein